jgi:rhodanese-related sulfurtransferase
MRFFTCLLLASLPAIVGCGTNRFEQELKTEEAAVKLTNETIEGNYPLIATADLKALLDSGESILLVDTMPTVASYNQGHLRGAVNFVFPKVVIDEWTESTMGEQKIEEYEAFLGEDKDRKIVFYCGYVKCPRSHNGAVFAKELGYTNVLRYPGGIDAWRGAGYELIAK